MVKHFLLHLQERINIKIQVLVLPLDKFLDLSL